MKCYFEYDAQKGYIVPCGFEEDKLEARKFLRDNDSPRLALQMTGPNFTGKFLCDGVRGRAVPTKETKELLKDRMRIEITDIIRA
jgi:hypothetical protein